jgi:hypothetical protein
MRPESLRTLLVLGRISNLPTVWSNCLSGWFIGGGTGWPKFFVTVCGASSLYVGGMYLNDFCDAAFDAEFRKERPIPAGKIGRTTVGWISLGWLAAGAALLVTMSPIAGSALVGAIVVYDCAHKNNPAAPFIMAGCRFLLVIAAGSTIRFPPVANVTLAGAGLASYILGLTYIAQIEHREAFNRPWALTFLLAPLAFSAVNYTPVISWYWLPTIGWILYSITPVFRRLSGARRSTVSRLLAGIPLVDWLFVHPNSVVVASAFVLLFISSLFLQSSIPAT